MVTKQFVFSQNPKDFERKGWFGSQSPRRKRGRRQQAKH